MCNGDLISEKATVNRGMFELETKQLGHKILLVPNENVILQKYESL